MHEVCEHATNVRNYATTLYGSRSAGRPQNEASAPYLSDESVSLKSFLQKKAYVFLQEKPLGDRHPSCEDCLSFAVVAAEFWSLPRNFCSHRTNRVTDSRHACRKRPWWISRLSIAWHDPLMPSTGWYKGCRLSSGTLHFSPFTTLNFRAKTYFRPMVVRQARTRPPDIVNPTSDSPDQDGQTRCDFRGRVNG